MQFPSIHAMFVAGQIRSPYRQKRMQREEEWAKIHPSFLSVHTEQFAPPQSWCCYCSSIDENSVLWRCLDCGPSAFFCGPHPEEHHRHSPFHLPESWNVSVQTVSEVQKTGGENQETEAPISGRHPHTGPFLACLLTPRNALKSRPDFPGVEMN